MVRRRRRHLSVAQCIGILVTGLALNVVIVHQRIVWEGTTVQGDDEAVLLEVMLYQHGESRKPAIVEIDEETNNNENRVLSPPKSNRSAVRRTPRRRRFDSVSACLLIKDDGDILNEWLAYHFHALRLRYLVVAVDPTSVTSPTLILDRWRNYTTLEVVEWSDSDFMPAEHMQTSYQIAVESVDRDASKSKWHEEDEDPIKVEADTTQIAQHRYRQLTFLSSCLRHMRGQNKTWTVHVDTDEYVVVNPLLRHTTQKHVRMIKVGPIERSSSVFYVIQQYYHNRKLRRRFNYPCICLPRLLFGSVEEVPQHRTLLPGTQESVMPVLFNTSRFETLRWKFHTAYNDTDRNAHPKVIVDVSVVNMKDQMFDVPFSIHRPSMRLCRRIEQLDFHHLQRYPITANHYLGSRERYFLSRNDTRRSERAYNAKAYVMDGYDDWMTPWVRGFVDEHGIELARKLLLGETS